MLAQSNVASSTPFRLETQHVHQLVVPCVRDSGIHLHSDSLRWRNHPLCHRPGEKTVVLLSLRLVGSTPTWSNRENVSNPPHRAQSRGHSLRGSARPLRVLRSDPTGQNWGSSGGSVQALKKVDMLAQSNVASSTPFSLEIQHVHQLVVPCVRDSGIQLHSDSLRWRNHPLCHRPGEETVVLLGLRLVGSTPTWSNRENVPNPPHRSQSRGHSLRGSARPLRVLWSDPTGRDWVRG